MNDDIEWKKIGGRVNAEAPLNIFNVLFRWWPHSPFTHFFVNNIHHARAILNIL